MATALSDMRIDEISLVDDGANQGAKVEIFKARRLTKACGACKNPEECMKKNSCMKKSMGEMDDDEEEDELEGAGILPAGRRMAKSAANAALQQEISMDLEQLSKALEEAEVRLDTLEKSNTELTDLVKAKDQRISELEGTIAKALDPASADEAFLKALPDVAREAVIKARAAEAAAQAELQKAREKQAGEEAIAKAKAIGFGDPAEIGPLLVRLSKGATTADDAALVERVLRSAGQIAGASALFKSLGAAAAVDGDPAELLKAKAQEIQKASAGTTYEAAYAKAVDENPALYGAYVAKRRG